MTLSRKYQEWIDARIEHDGSSTLRAHNPDMQAIPEKILLIPGLLEPRLLFLPLKLSLSKHVDHVECWRDRIVFRDLETSINRLAEAIAGKVAEQGAIAIVTHSFGDWIARAAIAMSRQHRVTAMVSLAPAMRAGFFPSLLFGLSGNLIPEIKVLMNRDSASANLDCDDRVRRLVIWSRFDESLRSVPLDGISNLQVQRVWATHFSIPWQPNVLHLVQNYLLHET
ncbi:lipase family protein [Rubripirellula lacrimiformis]|uniref:hypothetical protein n=1 Tax=Rubripirellula lacrimiformis TaxID=1930273 RepID=UPI00119EFC2F|nr:hypothetical protein [Rubripirellula lacrimiformis]